jgi:phosphoglycolate phosphatase-like HAD superfamily hydrolase
MTTKIAIVDLDGVVADSTVRFEKATQNEKINWKIAFTPDLVSLDTLMDGVADALTTLESQGYRVIFLTSRPEHMWKATEAWLNLHSLLSPERTLVLKPGTEQFTKTKVWKARMVKELLAEAQPDECLFIDDEAFNVEEVRSALPTLRCVSSLADL